MPQAPYKFSFQSLRSEKVPTTDATIQVGDEYGSEFASTTNHANRNATRFLGYCLLPGLVLGFIVFAALGVGLTLDTVDKQTSHAAFVGGRLYPHPPAPPPYSPRPPRPPPAVPPRARRPPDAAGCTPRLPDHIDACCCACCASCASCSSCASCASRVCCASCV